MVTFKIQGRDVAVTSLYPEGNNHNDASTYRLGCGCYVWKNKRWEWTGESIRGSISLKDLVFWAVEKGLAHFEQDKS
jgi:hypothetical protein